MSQYDLAVLVPDKNLEAAVAGILSRPEALQIKSVAFKIFVHMERDPGCYHRGHDFLRALVRQAAHALLIFDRAGCGQENKDRTALEKEVSDRLRTAGWADRSECIVIDPELEVWVWSDSPHVPRSLGWDGNLENLRTWLANERLWSEGSAKPSDPKTAVERTLRKTRKPRSSSLYLELAKQVSLQRCSDDAFLKLRKTLRGWFGTSLS